MSDDVELQELLKVKVAYRQKTIDLETGLQQEYKQKLSDGKKELKIEYVQTITDIIFNEQGVENVFKCSECDNEVNAVDEFCRHCGNYLKEVEEVAKEPTPTTAVIAGRNRRIRYR